MPTITPRSLQTASRLLVSLTAFLVLMVACQPQSPEARVAEARKDYRVQLNTWYPEEPPVPEIEDAMLIEGEDGETIELQGMDAEAVVESEDADGEAMMEGELEIMEPVGPRAADIFFDLIVHFDGSEPLPGITVDITQAGADGAEKDSWRHFLEIPDIVKSETKQVSFTIDGVMFEEGDQFSVLLVKNVDPAERGEYREFAGAAGE